MGIFDGLVGSVISGGASLFGGLLGNDASAKEAKKNRQWQEMMSNTAHQREVADLKAAGLNPILSANGGASSPPGSMATQSDPVTPAVNSALKGSLAKEQLNNLKADTAKKGAEAATQYVQQDLLSQQAQSAANANYITENSFDFTLKKNKHEAAKSIIDFLNAQRTGHGIDVSNSLSASRLPEARNEAQYHKDMVNHPYLRNLSNITKDLLGSASSARQLSR